MATRRRRTYHDAVEALCRLGATVMLLVMPQAARGHAIWGNGTPVPEWVTKACCGPSDAHHLRPDEVHRIADGFRIDGYPKPIYDFQVLPSQDGEYWAFYSTTKDAEGAPVFTSVFCFFAPSFG